MSRHVSEVWLRQSTAQKHTYPPLGNLHIHIPNGSNTYPMDSQGGGYVCFCPVKVIDPQLAFHIDRTSINAYYQAATNLVSPD